MEKVIIYPILKKPPGKEDKAEVTEKDIDTLADQLMTQVAIHLQNHGFDLSKTFLRDIEFSYEFLRSSMMRGLGKYHPFQDWVDDFDELKGLSKKELKERLMKDDDKQKD